MAIIKNALLFSGWIPSLLAGTTSVSWLTTDKTVEDVLRKTGVRFLSTTKDFENVYEKFEGEDNLIKDIQDVEKSKGSAISKWCKDTMDLSLGIENIKEIIKKATKYRMFSGKFLRIDNGFEKFREVINFLEKSKVPSREMRNLIIAHLGEKESEDVYYNFVEEDFKKDG